MSEPYDDPYASDSVKLTGRDTTTLLAALSMYKLALEAEGHLTTEDIEAALPEWARQEFAKDPDDDRQYGAAELDPLICKLLGTNLSQLDQCEAESLDWLKKGKAEEEPEA